MGYPTYSSKAERGIAMATIAAIFGTLVVNTLSNIFPPGGQNVGSIANTLLAGVLITPENYAFAIWGLIYVGLIAYGVYQLRPAQRRDPLIQRVDLLLLIACVAQIVWIFLFTLKFFSLSVIAMLAILLSLARAYWMLGIGQTRVSKRRRWMAHIPFSLYLAWISVATIVNVACALYASGWQGSGISYVGWTIIMMVVGGAIATYITYTSDDATFPLVYVWAYAAIGIRHVDIWPIWLTVLVILGVLLAGLFRQYRQQRLG